MLQTVGFSPLLQALTVNVSSILRIHVKIAISAQLMQVQYAMFATHIMTVVGRELHIVEYFSQTKQKRITQRGYIITHRRRLRRTSLCLR